MKLKSSTVIKALTASFCTILVISGCSKKNETLSSKNLTVVDASYVGQGWGVVSATINPDNMTLKVAFDYDSTTAFRHSVDALPDTISGTSSTTVNAVISGLKRNTDYYYRVKTIRGTDTTYSEHKDFITTNPGKSKITFSDNFTYGSVQDIEGNIYKTIVIGAQTWMAENLKTTKFNDGTSIPFQPASSYWDDSAKMAYCWYSNDSVLYGALYNWYTVNSGKLCPSGWHVPSDAEWTSMTDQIGGESTAATKLKETGTVHWVSSITPATNESGFTAIGSGYRAPSGIYNNLKHYAYFWTSTGNTAIDAMCRFIYSGFDNLNVSAGNKLNGLSVRCIKD